jgi:hypothetical protein
MSPPELSFTCQVPTSQANMPNDAQFRTLLRDKDTETLRRMEKDPSFTTEQWAMIAQEIRGRHAAPNVGAAPPRSASGSSPIAVRITDVDMPFPSMVMFMVKWTLASIPAFLFLLIVAFFAIAALASIGLAIRPPTP